jgi:myo-inositol-1(or 4)-monophosphatase
LCCDGSVNTDAPDELREVAESLAAEAAAFVRRRRSELVGTAAGPTGIRTKSSPTDPVTLADTETEQLLRDRLAWLRPGEPILGEEEGGAESAGAGVVRWVLDPIDGTVNFIYGVPAYAVSVAAQVDGVAVAGAVADVVSGDIYSAAIGRGAELITAGGRRRLRCNAVDDLSMALVGTGFGYQPGRRARQAALLAELLPMVRDVRRIGSAALDLCMVAAGRLDAHYEHGLHVWDWAAGALIATEAGVVVLLPGDETAAGAPPLVAAAPGIAAQLTAALDLYGGLGPLP